MSYHEEIFPVRQLRLHLFTPTEFGWKFGGCSDNFLFASQVAHQFLDDIVDREGSVEEAERAVRLHNINAGMVVSLSFKVAYCDCLVAQWPTGRLPHLRGDSAK